MQPQLFTIIVIIVILYVIQNTSNRIVKEKFDKTDTLTRNDFDFYILNWELDQANELCYEGKVYYKRNRNQFNHYSTLQVAERKCW
jgi:hypothetical protein